MPACAPIYERGPFRLRMAIDADLTKVVADLRESDRTDIVSLTNSPPEVAIRRSYRSALRKFTVDYQGEACAVIGIERAKQPELSIIWIVGNSQFDVMLSAGGARLSRIWFDIIREDHKKMFNIIPIRNSRTLKWLRWLGFMPVTRLNNFGARGEDCTVMLYQHGAINNSNISYN